jgi:hypothetical protein
MDYPIRDYPAEIPDKLPRGKVLVHNDVTKGITPGQGRPLVASGSGSTFRRSAWRSVGAAGPRICRSTIASSA